MRSWWSMLRTMRAAVAVLLAGGVALTVPPQTRDMLTFLDTGRIWPAISFQIALIVLGASAWFWSRAALAARFGIDDSRRHGVPNPKFNWTAFTWLPRFVLIGAFLVGAIMATIGRDPKTIAGAIVFGVIAAVLAVFRPRRPAGILQPARRIGFLAWIRGGARDRLLALLRRAPFGAPLALTMLVLGLVPLALGMIEAFAFTLRIPNILAAVFPGPGIAVFLLGLMIGPLVAATFVCDGLTFQVRLGSLRVGFHRPPVLSFILLYVFVLVPALFYVHTVRLIDGRAAERASLDTIFKQWVAACAPPTGPVQPVIVAVSGGATRAGLGGAAVLDRVLQAQQQDGPALFAVSSVSGGSLGTAAAMTLVSLEGRPCRAKGLPLLRATGDAPVPLAGDALGPLLGGWLINDIPRSAFDPFAALVRGVTGHRPNGGDSAEAIEHGFEHLWNAVRPEGAPGWNQPFLSLFYAQGNYRTGTPLWFANGTDATTGNRVITAPIAVSGPKDVATPWPFRGARDFHALMGADVSIATAINNTARFPYLEPFGQMLPAVGEKQAGSLVDGGYFENEGLQTALELAEWLVAQSTADRPVQPIIVQATGDGEADVGRADVMTCSNVSDGPSLPDDKHSAWQIFAPIVGLYHVRGGHSAVLLRQAHDEFCALTPRFVHFYLPADEGKPIPLNWVLSDVTAQFVWNAFTDKQVSNATALTCLAAALAPPEANKPAENCAKAHK
jgi:hypothetical protein